MKILIATGLYPPETGGPATYVKLLEAELPKRDIEVTVLPFSTVRHLPPGVRHVAYAWKVFTRSTHIDVIFAQDTVSVGLPAMFAAWLAGKIFFVRVPGDYAWEQARQRFGVVDELDEFQRRTYGWRVELLRKVQKFVVRGARQVVVPSEYMRRLVLGWGVRQERVHVIYSSVELPVPAEIPTTRPEGFLIVTAARLVPWKGVDGLLRVVVKEKSWHLVVVGDGPERGNLEALAQKLGVQDRARFTGQLPRAQALGWVKAADVFVLNSTYEGLSHLLVEAMSLARPVVATDVGGNPELVRDGTDGMLVPPQDNEALHRALAYMENNKEEAKNFGISAAARAQMFTIDNTVVDLCALFKTL